MDFSPEFGISAVVEVSLVFVQVVSGVFSFVLDFRQSVGAFEDEGVAAGAGTVGYHQDSIAGLSDIQNCCEPDGRGAGIGIAEGRHQPSRFDFFFGETEHFSHSQGKFAVGLMEYDKVEIFRFSPCFFHDSVGGAQHMLEISRFAGESAAVLRIKLMFPPPEIGGVSHEGIGFLDFR